MNRSLSTPCCAALVTLLACFGSQAEAQLGPYSYRTLESHVHNAEMVLLLRILRIDGEREQLGQTTYQIRYQVEEVIKGGDMDQGYLYLFAKREQIEAWIESKARLVVKSPFHTYGNSESAEVMIDLEEPDLMRLSLGEDGVLTAVESEEELLDRLRTIARRLPGVSRMRTFQMFTEPAFVERHSLIIQDGLPIVFAVIDKPLEAWAKRVIEGETELPLDPGVRALKHFKSEANIAWLRHAIADTDDESRRVALNGLLEDWGVPVGR